MTHSLFRFPFTQATIAHPLLATTHFHPYKRFPLTATTLTPNRRKVPSSAALAYAQSMLCTLAGRRTPTPGNPQFSPYRTEARGGRRCARLRRAGEGAGAGERTESSGAGRGEGSRERAQGRERQHRRWYCTAVYCGRGGSRHFREIEEKSPGSLSRTLPSYV